MHQERRKKTIWSRLAMFFGLIFAAFVAIGLDENALQIFRLQAANLGLARTPALTALPPRALDQVDQSIAENAWTYIANSTQEETGFVNSVYGYPSTTFWDQASYVLGLVSAHKLGIIADEEFTSRATKLLESLNKIPLFDDRLPNKAYHTITLEMVDYGNNNVEGGIGWSALDVARMLIALKVLEQHSPAHAVSTRQAVARWDLRALTRDGQLIGTTHEEGETKFFQEGRIGYEQYAARAMALWGIDVSIAISAQRILAWEEIDGINVPIDLRTSQSFGGITPTLSEPYMLQALEMGLSSEGAQLAANVYLAQEARFAETGEITMVSEGHLDRDPRFVYNSVHSNGREWAVVSESGDFYPELRTISFKSAISWHAIFDTDYTRNVRNFLYFQLSNPERGWASGIYEADDEINAVWTLNTNAVVLEAIHFKAFGRLFN